MVAFSTGNPQNSQMLLIRRSQNVKPHPGKPKKKRVFARSGHSQVIGQLRRSGTPGERQELVNRREVSSKQCCSELYNEILRAEMYNSEQCYATEQGHFRGTTTAQSKIPPIYISRHCKNPTPQIPPIILSTPAPKDFLCRADCLVC